MGLLINYRKSAIVPTQEFVFLGYDFSLTTFLYFPPQKRMQKIWDLICEFIKRRGAQARIWQVLLGLLASSEKMVPLGRLHMREIHFSLRACWDFDPLTHIQPIRPSVSIGTQQSLMVDAGVCVPGFTHCAYGSNRPLPHGRLSPGMGSALGHAHLLRTMDSGGSGETYQRSRVRRCGKSLRKVERPVWPEDSGRISPSPSHRARVRALRRRLLHLGGQTHTREKERPRRQPLQGGGLVASGE